MVIEWWYPVNKKTEKKVESFSEHCDFHSAEERQQSNV